MCPEHSKYKQGCRECHKLYMRVWRRKRPTTLLKAYEQGFKDGSGKKNLQVSRRDSNLLET